MQKNWGFRKGLLYELVQNNKVFAAPTNYDSKLNYFDTSSVEAVIEQVLTTNPEAYIVIKPTVPVGLTEKMQKNLRM